MLLKKMQLSTVNSLSISLEVVLSFVGLAQTSAVCAGGRISSSKCRIVLKNHCPCV